ncbi:Methyl-accepting chemotaxis sensory transducer [Desulfamplus magnetovallimortis]|uniref:Methyl-accepting chemotaxis sensory transducer n=1 Tax=Desulfamplus magnetovallimortis TaxID=1246637 RepID=A0A1W1H960_9BACT|nr:methyl-accepting chemotaxis protein [Desulfamplus magnetovallimortis]SLM29002.1 Methyl-accepting chemotaxis sensory transducer [Desulfamplus magnetovallimortis]
MDFKKISIKWKIFGIVLAGPIAVALILAVQRVNDIRVWAEKSTIEKSRAVVLMAEAGRNEMASKLKLGIMKPFKEIDKSKIVEAVPIITAIHMAKINAEKAGYEFRVPKFNPRNPQNTPTELESAILKEISNNNLEEKIVIEKDQIRYFKPVRLTKECLFCHGNPKGQKDPTGGTMEGWKEGEIHGAFEIITSLDAANEAVSKARLTITLWTSSILIVISLMVWLLIRINLVKPLETSREFIKKISKGDLTDSIQESSKDEFGEMFHNLNEMAANLRSMMTEISGNSQVLFNSSSGLQAIADSLSSGSEKTSGNANTVAVAAEEMSANMNSVAAAMEQASTNISIVATSAEDITRNIHTISNNSDKAREITLKAVKQAMTASERVDKLGKAATEIGKVTESISGISEQTNLLALNATIEAARAGEAGKGFAVVANEIKELAKQTSEATSEINNMIEGIQKSTMETVKDIEEISDVINNVNTTVSEIAVSVEEQSKTTSEIAENVRQASLGISEVNENVSQTSAVSEEIARDISDVNESAQEMSSNSARLNEKSGELYEISEKMKATVSQFKI